MDTRNQGWIKENDPEECPFTGETRRWDLCGKTTWNELVLKIKDNGRYHVKLVSKVILQREGVDYYLSHSPVLCDITFRLLLIYHIQNPYTMMVSVDIKKAFL